MSYKFYTELIVNSSRSSAKLMLPETNIFYFKSSSFLVIIKGTLNKINIILHICPH